MKSAPQHRLAHPITSALPQQHPSPTYLPLTSCCKNTETATLTTFRINTCESVSKQMTSTGSVDILEKSRAMPQAIEVKGQAQQQCLPHLQGQAATGGFRRELAFDHRDDRFYLRARAIHLSGESTVHPGAPGSFWDAASRVDRDDAAGSQRGADVAVIGLGVELRIGQHHPDGQATAGRVHQWEQRWGVAPRTLSSLLRQDDLAIHVGDQQPLQIVFIVRLPPGVLL